MTEPQPEYVWAHPETRPRRGRAWLIVILAIVALAIAGTLFWLFLRPGAPVTDPTPAPSTAPTTPVASRTPTPSASTSPEPTQTATAPPVADPSIDAFRAQVGGWLDDALTGLGIVAGTSGQDALAVIDSLQDDAQRLADARPPSSIATEWSDGVADYSQRLTALRTAVMQGSDAAVDDAGSAVRTLRSLVGL